MLPDEAETDGSELGKLLFESLKVEAIPESPIGRRLLKAICDSMLLIGADLELPNGSRASLNRDGDLPAGVEPPWKVCYYRTDDESGRPMLVAFTSWKALDACDPGHPVLGLPGKRVLRAVGDGDFEGLLINFGAKHGFFIPHSLTRLLAEGRLPGMQ